MMLVCGKLAIKLYTGLDCNGVKREQVLWLEKVWKYKALASGWKDCGWLPNSYLTF